METQKIKIHKNLYAIGHASPGQYDDHHDLSCASFLYASLHICGGIEWVC